MPLLSYAAITDYPFQPFTKIYSADVNGMFAAIQTLLNTTLLDHANVQAHGLNRYGPTGNFAAGTPNYAIYNDSNGDLAEAAGLPTLSGGTGSSIALTGPSQSGLTLAVNAAGTAFQLSSSNSASSVIFNYFTFS